MFVITAQPAAFVSHVDLVTADRRAAERALDIHVYLSRRRDVASKFRKQDNAAVYCKWDGDGEGISFCLSR